MRFIHTADWQIGMTRHFLDDDAQARFTDAREKAIRNIGTLAKDSGASFITVAGDVFDSNLLAPRTVRRALEALSSLSVPVYLLPGNHDALTPMSIYRSQDFVTHCPPHVHVLTDQTIHQVEPGVELVGAPLFSNKPSRDQVGDLAVQLPIPSPGTTRVLLGHGQASTLSPDAALTAIDVGRVEEALQQGRVHFVALGDRHSTTNIGTTGRIWFSGAPEPTDYDEIDSGNALVVELTPTTCKVTSHPIGRWRFVLLRLSLVSGEALAQVQAALNEVPDKNEAIVKLELEGTVGLAEKAQIDAWIEQERQVYAAIERPLHHDDLAVLPRDGEIADLSLTGFAQSAFAELRDLASSGDDASQQAQDALGLLYRLAGGAL